MLRVCFNDDFPEFSDDYYELSVDGKRVAQFNKWPRCWKRPKGNWRLYWWLLKDSIVNLIAGLWRTGFKRRRNRRKGSR